MQEKTLNSNITPNTQTIVTEISNPKKGFVAALIFGLVGAIIWAIVVKETGYNVGFVAILIGLLISQGFVWAGKTDSSIWGVVAAVIAALSIFIGKIFGIIIVVAEFYGITVLQLLEVIDYGQLMNFMVETFEVFDLVFYAIAIQTAYKRSFNNVKINYKDYMNPNQKGAYAHTDTESTSAHASFEDADAMDQPRRVVVTPESEAR